jgi:hypothetical protein
VADRGPVYGCVGADSPEAQAYIDEVDGVLYYTCPACRKDLAEFGFPLRSQPDSAREHAPRPAGSSSER